MEYANTLGTASAQRVEPARPLEGIGTAADRVVRVNARLAEIIDRFHGPSPQPTNGGEAPISVAYVNQVSRLHANLEQLENLVNSLAASA